MKRMLSIMMCGLLAISCAGCGQAQKVSLSSSSSVSQVLAAQTKEAEEGAATNDGTSTTTTASSTTGSATGTSATVDVDLTQMSSDMVYLTVYQMLVNPDAYFGKTVRMSGIYYASYYEVTGLYYQYCIIADATSCCSQGLEFIWDDGSHAYPAEYPDNYTQVEVTGTFGTYEELGVTYYCLLDATPVWED